MKSGAWMRIASAGLVWMMALTTGCGWAGAGGGARGGGGLSTGGGSGSLVIVGGGLKDDNRPVYERFVALAGGTAARIGIVPTASGDGLKAGEEVAERWRAFGPASVVVVPLSKDDAARADDEAVARTIADCTGLWFTGGDQTRIVEVFRPGGRETRALQSVRGVLARGGVVGGTSAGAAIMTDPMITGGGSARANRADPENPDSTSVRTGPGLGLLPVGLVDQHFLERNRMARLLDALGRGKARWGFGISENSAMVVDLRGGWIEAIGPAGVIVIDSSARPAAARVMSTGDRLALPAPEPRR